jgi:hypothetical protein
VHDPDDGTTDGQTDWLQAGPSGPPWFAPVPASWRRRAAAPVGFVLGVVAGVGAVLWWQDEPTTPPPFRADAHDVELVLFEAVPPRAIDGPLRVRGALLLSGPVTSTVLDIELLDQSFEVRAPQLPVTVAPSDRFRSINLRIGVRDCGRAARWRPAARPFTITWRDGLSRTHTDRAGDFDRSLGNGVVRYVDAVCGG